MFILYIIENMLHLILLSNALNSFNASLRMYSGAVQGLLYLVPVLGTIFYAYANCHSGS